MEIARSGVRIAPVDVRTLLVVRAAVLRPARPLETARFDGDEDPTTLHLGAFDGDGQLVGVVSVMRERPSSEAAERMTGSLDRTGRAWRLRGMAVVPAMQGRGVGRDLVQAALARLARSAEPRGVFLHSRAWVVGFYERFGFAVVGEPFDVAGIGPHRLMVGVLGATLRVD